MHIKELTLTNFRGAAKLTLNFDKKLNVLVGVNGAGKSSILDACAIMLSRLVSRIKTGRATGRSINVTDIRNSTSYAQLEIILRTDEYEEIDWSIHKERIGSNDRSRSRSLQKLAGYADVLQEQIKQTNGNANLPVLVYYPVNRAVVDIPLRIRKKHSFELLSTYEDSLTVAANFRTFFEWFREREDIENEKKNSNRDFEYRDLQLQAVRQALSRFMPEFSNIRIRRSPLRMDVDKTINDNKTTLNISQLSDGEKCLMAMVGDIVRRMTIASPMLPDPLQGQGVILIDELDLHLHPLLQREVVSRLVETFPNCQFIISTHSPHIITHVKTESLFFLDATADGLRSEHPQKSYGMTAERVLEDLMGLSTTRPVSIKNEIDEIYRYISRKEYDHAEKAISQLERKIGTDAELLRARTIIMRKGAIGK